MPTTEKEKTKTPPRGSASIRTESTAKVREAYYVEHLSEEEVNRSLGERYFTATLRVNPRKNTEAYVRCAGFNIDFRLDEDKHRNRSLHGDVVAIEVLPEESWVPWSAMMQAKLGITEGANGGEEQGESFEGRPIASMRASALAAADVEGEFTRLRVNDDQLWSPKSEMINSFRAKAGAEVVNKEMPASASSPSVDSLADGAGKVAGEHAKAKMEVELRSEALMLQPRARVVRVMHTSRKVTLVGTLFISGGGAGAVQAGAPLADSVKVAYFEPQEDAYPKMFVPRVALPEAFLKDPYNGGKQLYLVDVCETWPAHSRMSMGENVRSIGEIGDIEAETQALLTANGNNHEPYTVEALEPLRAILGEFGITAEPDAGAGLETWRIPDEELARRRDLRGHRIFTIDPSNAKDLDDALHITELADGTFELGVHIADVSFFLQPGTALDREAQNRATSVYLVQKVLPMLPAILCEQLCSLNPNVDRLAFSCIWRMNADGTLCRDIQPWFGKTVIRSCAKLDYGTAQRMIDGTIPCAPGAGVEPDDFLRTLPESIWEFNRRPMPKEGGGGHAAWACSRDVVLMHRLAMNRRNKRLQQGALVLDKKKLVFVLDERGNPETTTTYPMRESNQLVEEYMLLANYLVAEELLLKFGAAAFIRNHGNPDSAGLRGVQAAFEQLGYDFDCTNAQTISSSLSNVVRTANAETVRIVTAMLANPIPEALYLVAGERPDNWRHFALSIPYYTHFTSPIRRYADVMVHRMLDLSVQASILQEASGGANAEKSLAGEAILGRATTADAVREAAAIAQKCNDMNKASKKAQERSDRVYFSLYLRDKPMDVHGYVIGVGAKSFTVFVPELGVQDRLFVDNLAGVTYEYFDDEKRLQLYRPADVSPDAVATMVTSLPNRLNFTGVVNLRLFSPVLVHLSMRQFPKLDVGMSFIGPDASAIVLGKQ